MTAPAHKTVAHAATWPRRVRSFRRWAPRAAMRGHDPENVSPRMNRIKETGRSAFRGKHSDDDDDKKDTISTNGEEKGRPMPDDISGKHEKKDDENDDQC